MQSKSSNSRHTDPLSVNQVKNRIHQQRNHPIRGLSVIARFLEEIEFKEWVDESFPVKETSLNGKGKYPEVLSLLLTALSGGNRDRHDTCCYLCVIP